MRTKRTLRAVLLFLLLPAMLSGCWDASDINDRTIVTAIVVDKTEYGYVFYVEIPPTTGGSRESGGISERPTVLHAEGRTLGEARENLDRMVEGPVFLGAVQTVLLTDRLAAYDVEEYFLRLRQLNDYRKTVHVAVTTEDPAKLLEDKPERAQMAGVAVDQTLAAMAMAGELHHVSLMDVLEKLASPYKHYALPTVAIVNDEVAFTGLTVFSGGVKTGFIPAANIAPIVFIRAEKPYKEYSVPYKDTRVAVGVRMQKKKIEARYGDDGICFDMHLEFKTELIYPERGNPVTEADMTVIAATLKAMIEKEFMEVWRASREEYHYDCFWLHTAFRIKYPEEYKRMEWQGEYEKATLCLYVGIELTATELIDYNPEDR